jgi:hypothetical protein
MTLRHLWTTPILEEHTPLPEQMRNDLIKVLHARETARQNVSDTSPGFHEFMRSKEAYAVTPYNLFDDLDLFPQERESILGFERFACQMYRRYLKQAWEVDQADDIRLVGRCFGNIQKSGARTYPHYHQAMDGVLLHYLQIDATDPQAGASARHGSHALLLLDPRGTPNYPYWEKVESIAPYEGLTVIHPANVWHETNVYRGEGDRVVIVVNFQAASHCYVELQSGMRF